MPMEMTIQYSLRCDSCSCYLQDSRFRRLVIVRFSDDAKMYKQANRQGWINTSGGWYCKHCQNEKE